MIASPSEIAALADAVPDRYRAMVLLAAYSGLRWAEVEDDIQLLFFLAADQPDEE